MIRIYAHRGASRELPENTIPAFRRALEVGADALETDVHVTADGVLVVSHDPDGARVFGRRRMIRDCTAEEVRGWGMPTFEELLREFPRVPVNVDLKVDCAAAAVELLRRVGEEQRVLLASFSASTLRRVRALGYRGQTGLAETEVRRLVALPTVVQRGVLGPPGNAAQLPTSWAKKWLVDRCHALGLHIDYWTVNDPAEARAIAALGADGIMTDDPRAIVAALR